MKQPASLALAGIVLAALLNNVSACGKASRANARVEIAEESAIIIWDAGSKMQHFIRRATFTTDTPDFGFLVPTPTQPALAESKNESFAFLATVRLKKRDFFTAAVPIPRLQRGGKCLATRVLGQICPLHAGTSG